jgi:prepilin-type N-terminal cleavage/methylation domain-containing protein
MHAQSRFPGLHSAFSIQHLDALDIANNALTHRGPEQPRMEYRRKPLSPHAFTLIEVLIVISILAILMTIAFVGFRAIERTGRVNKTKMFLANAASMLTEYDAATGLKKQPSRMWTPAPTRVTTPGFDIWRDADPSTSGVNDPIRLFASVDIESAPPPPPDEPDPYRFKYAAVLNTAVVFEEMSKVPNAKSMFSKLPTESTMVAGVRQPDGSYRPATGVSNLERQPILLDGWDNPIIFVPASGLEVVMGDPAVTYVVTSVKTYPASGPGSLPAGQLAPGARPFFASAGPDGAFGFIDKNNNRTFDPPTPGGGDASAGDDNVYSFQN